MNDSFTAKQLVASLLDESVLPSAGSYMTLGFGRDFAKLPPHIKQQCHEVYHRWASGGNVNFEYKFFNYYAIELSAGFHAICALVVGHVEWLFVGKYTDYTRALNDYRAVGPHIAVAPPPKKPKHIRHRR